MNKTLNIIGFIVGIIGLIIGLISYLNTVKSKEVSYNTYSPSYKIFDSEAINGDEALPVYRTMLNSTFFSNSSLCIGCELWESGVGIRA